MGWKFQQVVVQLSMETGIKTGKLTPARLLQVVHKTLGPEDDTEAFLETFERVAETAKWPKDHWACLLSPYLMGEAPT